MTRAWLSLSMWVASLALPTTAFAQVDFDAIRSGVAGCPELAADPEIGNLGAFLCQPVDRTSLDLPINQSGVVQWEIRAGSFSPTTRPSLTAAGRSALGDSEFFRLQNLLAGGQVLSRAQDAYRLALLAEASEAEAAGDSMLADALRAEAAAILGTPETTFDANIEELLQARSDPDRLAYLRSGLLHSLGAVDTLGQYDPPLSESVVGTIGGLPQVIVDGVSVLTPDSVRIGANPFFVGPDALRNTADDLPYVTNNAVAQAAGYLLGAPIAGTVPDRFDATFGSGAPSNPRRPVFSQTAQIYVPHANSPGSTKLVELYGVYGPEFLIQQGCLGLTGATFNRVTAQCVRAGVDVSAEAMSLGCPRIARINFGLSIGQNADGDCIEVNMSAPSGAQIQFEVLALLGDLTARPPHAMNEQVDLTDIRAVADGGIHNTLPARPRNGDGGNVSFPAATSDFRRLVDSLTGAPLATGGTECRIRTNAEGDATGPNGIAGDGDDTFPSSGSCLLWSPPATPDGPQTLRSTGSVAALHNVNQTLFHTLCTVSFDSDNGSCSLDWLNDPRGFGVISLILSGLGSLAPSVLGGVETIQTDPSSVIQRGDNAFLTKLFLPIEPLAAQTGSLQDLSVSLRPGQAGLLGCGPGYASACGLEQQQQWLSDPAIASDLARDPALGPSRVGGIDLMNTVASVFRQEFATVKQLNRGSLVGTTAVGAGPPAYLPGVNFSRTGQQAIDVDLAFTRQGVPLNPPLLVGSIEPGSYLPLTPTEVTNLGAVGRAEYQTQPGNLREADGWVEGMPWSVNQEALDTFGAIVFDADPSNPLDLDSPLNKWNLIDGGVGSEFVEYSDIDGEYCAQWMNKSYDPAEVATPFNLGCTALETVSANLERWGIESELIGPDRVFDPAESLQELVAMLDGDPTNDATGDPIAGPDGIFARNQLVLSDEQADFDVLPAAPGFDSTFVPVPVDGGEEPKAAAAALLESYDPSSCPSELCYLAVNNVLIDPDDATSTTLSLILAMPLAFPFDVVVPEDANDPDSEYVPTGTSMNVNLAGLQYFDLPTLRRLLASRVVAIDTPSGFEFVRMSTQQHDGLLGAFGSSQQRGRDMDNDGVSDLDRNGDRVWDGADDFLTGPSSDDSPVCGSGIPGDVLQDAVQYRPYRADERPGTASFQAVFPDGLPPRSPLFCRELNGLLGLIGPVNGESDAFLWHGGASAAGTDDDEDGFPDVLDNCPTIANATQADADADGVGDACDNCTEFTNPRVADDYLASHPWATLTGGQRDDDHDGFGNLCDADFTPGGVTVGPADLVEYRASSGKHRADDVCGTSGSQPCSIFDLDETGECVGPDDLTRYRELSGKRAGPKCAACPLPCETGEPGGCD